MKITKKQIVQLDKKETTVRELFPEVFETKLEAGKWYKKNGCLFNYQKERSVYGFFRVNIWEDKNWSWNAKDVIPATKEEVETALINEAKKIGFNNIDTLSIKFPDLKIYPKGFFARGTNTFKFYHKKNVLEFSCVTIFDNGTWAEIIKPKQMTKEEIEKELGYEIEIKS